MDFVDKALSEICNKGRIRYDEKIASKEKIILNL